MANGYSIAQMMSGASSATSAQGPIPTVTFGAANIVGTAVPQVGNPQGAQYSAAVGSGHTNLHVALIVAAIIVGGYALHHFYL